MSYFILGILPMVIFGKNELRLELTGHTNHELDLSIDSVMLVTLPFIKKLGIELEIKLKQRGINGKVLISVKPTN